MFPHTAYHNESYSPEVPEISIRATANYYLDLKMVFDNQDFASAEDYQKQATTLAYTVIPEDPTLYEWTITADLVGIEARRALVRLMLEPNPNRISDQANRVAEHYAVWRNSVAAAQEMKNELAAASS